jgi:hypothetical protein
VHCRRRSWHTVRACSSRACVLPSYLRHRGCEKGLVCVCQPSTPYNQSIISQLECKWCVVYCYVGAHKHFRVVLARTSSGGKQNGRRWFDHGKPKWSIDRCNGWKSARVLCSPTGKWVGRARVRVIPKPGPRALGANSLDHARSTPSSFFLNLTARSCYNHYRVYGYGLKCL